MIGLDTNVLVRYLVRDDLHQWQIADQLIQPIVDNQGYCLINNVVLCELVWVLRSSYKLSRPEIIAVLENLLQATAFEFEDRGVALSALQQMKLGSADFADYLIGQTNRQLGCSETVTFDAKLKTTDGFECLG